MLQTRMGMDMRVRELSQKYWSGIRMTNNIKELYAYREMIASLIKRELRGKYKASVLGFLWTLMNPLLQMVVYIVVFSFILKSGIENFPIFLFVSLVPWNFFSISVTSGSTCVINQENLIKKIYFPRVILPISYVTSMFINMLLTFVVIFAVLLLTGYGLNLLAICFLPLIMIIEYILALGICMITSALAVYFRDLEYIMGIITMAWMYLTPILYTADMVPESIRTVFNLNPMTPIIEAYQQILYHKQIPTMNTLVEAALIGIVAVIIGYWGFQKMQRKFVEEL